MAEPKPNDKPTETPLGRTAQLARKLLAVRKDEADKQQQKWQKRKRS
jgi:hypothetical protein